MKNRLTYATIVAVAALITCAADTPITRGLRSDEFAAIVIGIVTMFIIFLMLDTLMSAE